MRRLRALLAMLVGAACATPASASTQLWATINPESEGSTTAGNGYGEGRFVLNDAGTELSFHITFVRLTSNMVGAHIHEGAEFAPGPVVYFLAAGGGTSGAIDGVWNAATTPYPLTPARVQTLLAGGMYVNIHSANYLPGEIRGQILFGATPVHAGSWGRIKRLYR
jgi:hypothetical protein